MNYLVLIQVLRATGDAEPRLDAVATVLSVIGTWWLAQSYLQQWLLWIVADIFTTTLCIITGQYWLIRRLLCRPQPHQQHLRNQRKER